MGLESDQNNFSFLFYDNCLMMQLVYLYRNRRMLPLIKQSQSQASSNSYEDKSLLKKSTISKTSKCTSSLLQVEQKLQNQVNLNEKLKKLLASLKQNVIDASISANEQEDQITHLIKQRRKQQTELQHQAHILNILISDNAKLKDQVNSQRNKRAIYFNVYKNLEHEIHQWEVKYKNLLIQSMKSEGAITKLKEKFRKATKKIERDIQSLNTELNDLAKLDSLEQKFATHITQLKSTKNLPNNQLPNVPVTVPEIDEKQKWNKYRKSVDQQLEYELQQKTILASGILNKLKNITGLSDINQIAKCYKEIDDKIQSNFKIFKEEEKKEKELLDKILKCEQELAKIQAQNIQRNSTKTIGVDNLADLSNKNKKIIELQRSLQQRIGIKVGQLSNEMLLHHCLRVRDQRRQGKKNLQKYLEQTKKQKPQYTILLSPKQMHKKIIQGQTSLI